LHDHQNEEGTSETLAPEGEDNPSQWLKTERRPANSQQPFKNYLQANGYSISTIKGHIGNVENLTKWSEKQSIEVENISYPDLMAYVQYLNNKGTGKGIISKYIRSIKHYFNHLVKEEITESNPALNIQIKGIKRKMVYDILKPVELEALYHKFITTDPETHPRDNTKTRKLKSPNHQKQKVMVGLLIYQGVTAGELAALKTEDVKLREGMVYIPSSRRSNERELKLEAVQILEMQEYLIKTRPEILQITNKSTEQLFASTSSSPKLHNAISSLTQLIKKQNPRIDDLQQIMASVIVKWLNQYNLRQAQYMAGHRFVSSTEKYKQSNLEDLKEDINKFHPTI